MPVAQEPAAESKKPADAPVAVAQEPAPEPQQSAETPRAEPLKQERPQDAPPVAQQDAAHGAPPGTRRLWGREFAIVNGVLSPDQVVSFVESVRAEYDERLQEKGGSNTWDSFSKQVLAEAEREAARIRLKAQQEAEVEAARLISEGKRRAQEETEKASRRAQEITEKGCGTSSPPPTRRHRLPNPEPGSSASLCSLGPGRTFKTTSPAMSSVLITG